MSLMVSISGIRGIVGGTLTPETIVKSASAFGEYCNRGTVILGRDGRLGIKSEQSRIILHCFFIPCYNACHKPKELTLAKRAGAFKSDKRRKEMSRQKKQEEKRQRRFCKGDSAQKDTEIIDSENKETEQAQVQEQQN